MRVLVTGGAGFIGSWTVAELSKRGHDVIATDKVVDSGIVQTDITDLEAVLRLFDQAKPDAVVHLAAISGSTGKNEIEQSLRQAHQNFQVNTLGTANVCEASRKSGVKKLIYMSSFAVYGRTGPDRLPITPDTPISLEHAYATSKYAGELVVRNYSEDFGISSTIFRTPFVVGEFQKERNVVKEFIEAAVGGEELVTFGDGRHVREFIHPLDLVKAYEIAIMQSDHFKYPTEIFVLGNTPIAIRDLASKIIEKVGRGKMRFQLDSGSRAFNQYSDYSKAEKLLGWRPALSITAIIERCVFSLR